MTRVTYLETFGLSWQMIGVFVFLLASCTDYLDLEARLDLSEIEPRPERLDRQLLEVMLSHHSSGLAVVAAPHRPAEMRSFDPQVVRPAEFRPTELPWSE